MRVRDIHPAGSRFASGFVRCGRSACWMLCLLLGVYAASPFAQTVYVPVSHWGYDYLDRLETLGRVERSLSQTRPMTRLAFARILLPLQADAPGLGRADREALIFLRREFQEEFIRLGDDISPAGTGWNRLTRHPLIDPWAPDILYADGRHMLSFTWPDFSFHLDPVIAFDPLWAHADTVNGTEKTYHKMQGLKLWGTAGRHWGFYADVRDNQEWGTRDYPGVVNFTREGLGFVRGNGRQMDYDETSAGVVYQNGILTLQFGKERNRWGPGVGGQLMISARATSYDQLKMELGVKHLRFTSLWAVLQHYQDDYFMGNHQEKYLAAHRLEVAPWRFLTIGLHEAVFFAQRKFEPAYVLPVMFFRSAEHYLGDRDNAAMGLDVSLYPGKRIKAYGELLIDDISTGRLGTDFYGNKYAWLLGLYHADVLGVAGLDVRGEYARIRPFTYTHYGVTNFQQYSTNLGHRYGPNSEGWLAQLTWRPAFLWQMQATWERTRHGANAPGSNAGGSLYEPWNYLTNSEHVAFLGGDLQSASALTLSVRCEVIRNGTIHFYYRHADAEWAGRAPGYPGRRNEFGLRLGLNE